MIRSGTADLPLHGGRVPLWLADRMAKLGGQIIEAIVYEYGRSEVLTRLSDPLWFQALGCVLGMDWHSSGITTSVMGALKKSVNRKSQELGVYICGGRGRHSKKTPQELMAIALRTGMDGNELIRTSKLSAKVDNTAIQDGYQIYLHNFILTKDQEWAVIQQGMNGPSGYARRYHWHSTTVRSFVREPHTGIVGQNAGRILNMTDKQATNAQQSMVQISKDSDMTDLRELRKIVMPKHHDVRTSDVNLRRLGAVLAFCQDTGVTNFESLLLAPGLGPRTLQSLALVSEIIHGTPTRFADPARFSFAHGGKDGHPFPVPLKIYDRSIQVLKTALDKSKIDHSDKREAFRRLHDSITRMEKQFTPNNNLKAVVQNEWKNSHRHGGMTVAGPVTKVPAPKEMAQLALFSN